MSLLMIIVVSSLSSLFAQEVNFLEAGCRYEITNGPSEIKKVIAPFVYNSATPSRSLSYAYACSSFFTETHERLNPTGTLAYKIYVNNRELVKGY